MGYKLSRKAEEDVVDIFVEGVGLFGIAQAERYHSEFEECFRFIANNPEVARQRFELDPPIRVYPFGSHLVIYSVEPNNDVFIIRIRHGREDWSSDRQ